MSQATTKTSGISCLCVALAIVAPAAGCSEASAGACEPTSAAEPSEEHPHNPGTRSIYGKDWEVFDDALGPFVAMEYLQPGHCPAVAPCFRHIRFEVTGFLVLEDEHGSERFELTPEEVDTVSSLLKDPRFPVDFTKCLEGFADESEACVRPADSVGSWSLHWERGYVKTFGLTSSESGSPMRHVSDELERLADRYMQPACPTPEQVKELVRVWDQQTEPLPYGRQLCYNCGDAC